jgi:excisionase family DNA binding protein
MESARVYLTPAEAAAIFRVDRRTLYSWLRSGKLKGFKIGGAWRIPRSEVEMSGRSAAR